MNKRFKLYLLSILYGFYNDGNVRMAVTEDEVVESRKRYVEGKYILFASEQEYFEFMED